MRTFIETFTGRQFYPLAPRAEDVRIEDIAHGLANQCRYSGQCRAFYSVAEHSVRVSYAIPVLLVEGFQMWGLLHDASEAYLVDLPRPLKATNELGVPYLEAEKRLMGVICDVFGLSREMPAVVNEADLALLATEVRDLMHPENEYWANLPAPLPERIVPWSPSVAEYEFLRRYRELGGL